MCAEIFSKEGLGSRMGCGYVHVSVCGLEASQKIIIRFLSKMIIHASNETLI